MAEENRTRSIREPESNADGGTRPADRRGPDPTANFERLEIGALDASGVGEALDVTARGMRDNPLHVAAFGDDPELRLRKLRRMFGAAAGVLELHRHLLVARDPGGAIVGVCGTMPPGGCRPSIGQQLRLMPQLLANGPRATLRTARWLGAWAKRDPKIPHWHLGPVAVDAHLQGAGIGSRLMEAYCARVDAAGGDAYLETDKPANVRFYERFGFEVVGEQEILGVPNWFMLRQARLGQRAGEAADGAGLGEERRHGGEGPGMAGHPYQEVRGDREFLPGGSGLGDCAAGAQRGRVPVPRRCGDGSVAPRGRVPRLLRSRPALGGAAWSSFRKPDGDVYEIIEKEA